MRGAWRSQSVLRCSLTARKSVLPHSPALRTFARVRDLQPLISFTPSISPQQQQDPSDQKQPDERTLRLALRILQPLLPTLLASPLPQEILSPQITLHLFPSTHPHLPTVSGRVAYHAALWTSPITWGKIPLVGNVNLEILSERMVRASRSTQQATSSEKLIVRWRTAGKTKGLGTGGSYRGIGAGETVDRITAWLGGDEKRDDREFCGKFIFDFDAQGRILEHVIERAEEGWDGLEQWENGFGRVVGLTDWLLGRLGGKGQEKGIPGVPTPGIALGCYHQDARRGGRL